MTSLPPSSKYLQRANAPVDETERESMSKRLGAAYADGRLDHQDYMAALDVVYGAQTLGDLVPVAEMLPAPAADVPDIVKQGTLPAGEVSGSRDVTRPAAVVGGAVVLLLILALLLVLL